MISSKKTKIASELDITQMPNIFRVIQNDIKSSKLQVQQETSKYGNIYFNKDYNVNLYGWSGLQRFYNNLEKIKKLKQHDDIAVINRVVLDPTLCVRILNKQQAKQFWQKDFNYRSTAGKPFSVSVVICDYVFDAKGFYNQADQVILIQKSDIKNMINTLHHQFVHVLDHVTAITLKQNCDKLIQNADFTPPKGNGIDDSHLFKTPNDDGKDVDLYDVYNTSTQQYSSSFIDFVNQLKKDFIEDMIYRHRQFYVEDISNVLFSYITQYNVLKNTLIDRNVIIQKLKQIQEKTNKLYYDLFEYILTHNQSEIINYFNNLRKKNNVDYIGIIKDMYQQIKHDNYIGNLNQIEKEILSSI